MWLWANSSLASCWGWFPLLSISTEIFGCSLWPAAVSDFYQGFWPVLSYGLCQAQRSVAAPLHFKMATTCHNSKHEKQVTMAKESSMIGIERNYNDFQPCSCLLLLLYASWSWSMFALSFLLDTGCSWRFLDWANMLIAVLLQQLGPWPSWLQSQWPPDRPSRRRNTTRWHLWWEVGLWVARIR